MPQPNTDTYLIISSKCSSSVTFHREQDPPWNAPPRSARSTRATTPLATPAVVATAPSTSTAANPAPILITATVAPAP
ncbi:hypothetical protein C8R44DRAFT_896259 [Mycena epipterygia]|nr:hypothetical protein C8R44DRAFT_896259 [Mycena epipterygia]